MRKHVFTIALIWLFVGTAIGAAFILGHIYFFSNSSILFPESSVLDENLSFLQRRQEDLGNYLEFFGRYGINPLVSFFTMTGSLCFGYGLLKFREWARKLGFLFIAFNLLTSINGMIEGRTSAAIILQIALCGYMCWVFTSAETIRLMKGKSGQPE